MHLKAKTLFVFLFSAMIALTLFSCANGGKNVSSVTLEEARSVFDAARFTGAAVKSPYEFFSAEIYLKKAGDEMDLGNDKLAAIYLNKGYEQAQIAYENAKRYQRSQ